MNKPYYVRMWNGTLVLCSPNLQVGDFAWERLTNGRWEQFEIHTLNDIFPESIAKKEQFKLIGEISEEADYVNEDDVFFDDEVSIPRNAIWSRNPDTGLVKVRVKGPCGHFH